jgi:hypothetical protein
MLVVVETWKKMCLQKEITNCIDKAALGKGLKGEVSEKRELI